MTDRELMQQALEALDGLSEPYDVLRIQTALRERLAQPEDRELEQRQYQSTADKCKLETVSAKGGLLPAQQEPVAWMNPMNGVIIDAKKKTQIGEGKGYPSFSVPCYTAIQRKPSGGQDRELMQQALDALEFHTCGDEVDEALITALRERLAQPEREWVGLTDEEVKDIVWNLPYEPTQEHIRAIEAKLKEKNGQ